MKIFIFILFLSIFLVSSGGHLDGIDGKHHYMLTENLVLHQTQLVYLDLPSTEKINYDMENWFKQQYSRQQGTKLVGEVPESMYWGKAPLLSYIAIPFYMMESLLGTTAQITPFLTTSIILALIALVVFDFGAKLYRSKKIGFVVALIMSVCSFLWPYTSSFFQQPLVALLIISSFYFSIRGQFLLSHSRKFS